MVRMNAEMFWKIYETDYVMKCWYFKQFKEKHSVNKKSVCIDGEWKKEEMMESKTKEEKNERKEESVKRRKIKNVCLIIVVSVNWNPST